jgi:peptide deformylase
MKILKFPDPILREKIPDFDFNNPSVDPIEFEKEMIQIMLDNHGMGLAANQIGQRVRMFVIGHSSNPESAQAFYNPVVVAHIDETEDLLEGCLSFPGVYVNIKRPKKIKVQWQNSKGERQEAVLEGYECKCFLHELDHLEGIVFQDRVSTLKWSMALKKGNKRKNR